MHLGPAVPFGEGDTPIVEVLRLIRDNHWTMQATIEFEYKVPAGSDRMTEIAKCVKVLPGRFGLKTRNYGAAGWTAQFWCPSSLLSLSITPGAFAIWPIWSPRTAIASRPPAFPIDLRPAMIWAAAA